MCFLGLDTYEEGEMYVNGEETSGYREIDFENYRKKYIGNIFQSFNLVNSYTVYQNIELVLLVNGYKKSEVKQKILDVIEKVDLMKYKNTKVSKLSGGQKQRVAIARALVKDTPILVADEPTGNLDAKSAENIMALLHEVSKNKLMILVTHNYEQAKNYATRKIMMHDGKVIEDKKISPTETNHNTEMSVGAGLVSAQINKNQTIPPSKHMKIGSKIRLGIRNTFNIFSKFVLLLAVYVVLILAVLGGYSSLAKQEYEKSKLGTNQYFVDTNEKRIVIKKKDETMITKEDYEVIKQLPNVESIIENDLFLDQQVGIQTDNFGFQVRLSEIEENLPLHLGRMPENEEEAILEIPEKFYPKDYIEESILNKDYIVRNMVNWIEIYENKIKVVGIILKDTQNNWSQNSTMYIAKNKLDIARKIMNSANSELSVEFNNHIMKATGQYRVIPNKKVPSGSVYGFEGLNSMTKKKSCKNQNLILQAKNRYFEEEITLKITQIYHEKNSKTLLGIDGKNLNTSTFYVNPEDYYALFEKGNFQSSVFVQDLKNVEATLQSLEQLGYKTLFIKDTLVNYSDASEVIGNAVRFVMVIVVIVSLFFLSYFIIKIILKSRNVYYSTIRMLGATRKNAKQLLRIELITVLHIAYGLVLGGCYLLQKGILKQAFLQDLIRYLNLKDYGILYMVLIFISLLISNRYARQLFQKSVMNTYKEEV